MTPQILRYLQSNVRCPEAEFRNWPKTFRGRSRAEIQTQLSEGWRLSLHNASLCLENKRSVSLLHEFPLDKAYYFPYRETLFLISFFFFSASEKEVSCLQMTNPAGYEFCFFRFLGISDQKSREHVNHRQWILIF